MFRALFLLLVLSSSALIWADTEEEESDNGTDLSIETVEKPESCVDQVDMGDTIQLHYTGRLEDGRVIDSSLSRDPLVVILGKKQVIPGLEKSLLGMCVGPVIFRIIQHNNLEAFYTQMVRNLISCLCDWLTEFPRSLH